MTSSSTQTVTGISNSGSCQPPSAYCPASAPFQYTVPVGSSGTFTLTESCSTVGTFYILANGTPCSFTVGYTITPAAPVSGRKLMQVSLPPPLGTNSSGTTAGTCYNAMTYTFGPCSPSSLPSPPPPTPGALYGARDLWGQPETVSTTPYPLHMFEVTQSCSSARIQRANILNAVLCQPLQALPPYACSRTVRKPALEIISLATGNALSAMGAYFMLTSLFLKWKLARDAERKNERSTEDPQHEAATTPVWSTAEEQKSNDAGDDC
jgi:hypothetical protein